MTILTSLKELLAKMGGTSKKSANTISEVIDEITNAYEGGGSAGGGVFVVHANVTEDDNNSTVIVTEDIGDISEAVEAEKELIMYATYNDATNQPLILRLAVFIIGDEEADTTADFYATPVVDTGYISQTKILYTSGTGWYQEVAEADL